MARTWEADPETFARITSTFAKWDEVHVHYKGEVIKCGGHDFCGLGRRELLNILQDRAMGLGVAIHYRTEVEDLRRYSVKYAGIDWATDIHFVALLDGMQAEEWEVAHDPAAIQEGLLARLERRPPAQPSAPRPHPVDTRQADLPSAKAPVRPHTTRGRAAHGKHRSTSAAVTARAVRSPVRAAAPASATRPDPPGVARRARERQN